MTCWTGNDAQRLVSESTIRHLCGSGKDELLQNIHAVLSGSRRELLSVMSMMSGAGFGGGEWGTVTVMHAGW